MEQLLSLSYRISQNIDQNFKRFLYDKINWDNKLIAITGSRGVGKTTLMLQYLANHYEVSPPTGLYVSLDDFYFAQNSILDFADKVSTYPFTHILIDEVHKYPKKHPEFDWSREIKNIYDGYPGLKVVISGSSILEIYKGQGDLSRRMTKYNLPGLSFREFLDFENILYHEPIPLDTIIKEHETISREFVKKTKILYHFHNYLKYGYYPFYKNDINETNDDSLIYYDKIKSTINQIIESDLTSSFVIDYEGIHKLKRLLMNIASSVPYTPNFRNLQNLLNTDYRTLIKYFDYLTQAQVLIQLNKAPKGNAIMRKPDKVYLNNSNLIYALTPSQVNIGTVRETFFINQLMQIHKISTPESGDFMIDDNITIEVGGKNKDNKQLKDVKNSYIAADNIEFGFRNKIPLWLFGFLY